MSYELKVKAKSLAAEAKIIRVEERKYAKAYARTKNMKAFWAERDLYHHRTGIVRDEARATNLARGYLKGFDRSRVEKYPMLDQKIIQRVETMVSKYKKGFKRPESVKEWLAGV